MQAIAAPALGYSVHVGLAGLWTAYQQMLEDDPEQIVHLGDYRNHHGTTMKWPST